MNTRMTVLTVLVAVVVTATPLGTEFTYQGVLSDAGSPAAGDFDFRFLLYDDEVGGSQVGSIVYVEDLTVSDGRFTTQLDFGSVFDGTALWLQVGVREGGSIGTYTVLSPRQELTATPFAQHAQVADSAETATTANTAGHATTAGDADTVDGQHGSYYLTWSNFVGIPGDLADGDDDTLADLSCGAEEIARWNGSAWNCSSDDDTPYSRTYVVGPVGTPTQNGTALRNAIDAITPPVSQEEAVLLKIEPGLYDVGVTGIEIWAWMTLEGAGRDLTKITSVECLGSTGRGTLVIGSSFSGVRRVWIENMCADGVATSTAVYALGADVTIDDARIEAMGAAGFNYALSASGDSGELRVSDVDVRAENATGNNRAVNNYWTGAIYEGITAEAVGGRYAVALYNHRSDVVVRSSTLKASLGSSNSRGYDGISAYDGVLEDVNAETTAGTGASQGVNIQLSSGTRLVDVRAVGEIGIYITGSTDVTLLDVTVDAVTDGIYLNNSSGAVMSNIVIDGAVTGVDGNFSATSIMHSRVSGSSNSIDSSGNSITLESVILIGAPVTGSVTCTACIRNGVFIGSGCP